MLRENKIVWVKFRLSIHCHTKTMEFFLTIGHRRPVKNQGSRRDRRKPKSALVLMEAPPPTGPKNRVLWLRGALLFGGGLHSGEEIAIMVWLGLNPQFEFSKFGSVLHHSGGGRSSAQPIYPPPGLGIALKFFYERQEAAEQEMFLPPSPKSLPALPGHQDSFVGELKILDSLTPDLHHLYYAVRWARMVQFFS